MGALNVPAKRMFFFCCTDFKLETTYYFHTLKYHFGSNACHRVQSVSLLTSVCSDEIEIDYDISKEREEKLWDKYNHNRHILDLITPRSAIYTGLPFHSNHRGPRGVACMTLRR